MAYKRCTTFPYHLENYGASRVSSPYLPAVSWKSRRQMSLSLLPLFREFSCLRNDTLHLSSPAILRTMAPHIVLLSANSLIAVSRKSLTLLVSLTLCPVIAIHTSKCNCATVFALAPFIVSTGFRAFGECASCPAHLLGFQLIDGSCLSGSSPQLQSLP